MHDGDGVKASAVHSLLKEAARQQLERQLSQKLQSKGSVCLCRAQVVEGYKTNQHV